MGFYAKHILPVCLDKACSIGPINKQRAKIVPLAKGNVVEIGIGSGLNLPHYNPDMVTHITGIDPDEAIWRRSQDRRENCLIKIKRIGLSGESIPLENSHADTVVVTYSLCTIPDPVQALREMKRILKPNGQLLFCEHGLAPDTKVAKLQTYLDPFWKRLSGGCHSGRNIPHLITEAGFNLKNLQQMYIPGPRVLSYNYWGQATH